MNLKNNIYHLLAFLQAKHRSSYFMYMNSFIFFIQKIPDPDAFSNEFYQIIKEEIILIIHQYQEN